MPPDTIDGKPVPGYRSEPGVSPTSRTETFVAAQVLIDNWRWAGVPFYLRTGKRLAKRTTEIVIQFKRAPHIVFRERDVEANRLVLNIQPDEGISVSFGAKKPGTGHEHRQRDHEFQLPRRIWRWRAKRVRDAA